MLPRPLKAITHRECFVAVWLGNIAHSRDRICKWDKISVTARKVPSVQTFSCCTASISFGYDSAEGDGGVKCYELNSTTVSY